MKTHMLWKHVFLSGVKTDLIRVLCRKGKMFREHEREFTTRDEDVTCEKCKSLLRK